MPIIKKLIVFLVCVAIILAGIFAVMFSTITQSIPLLLLVIATLLSLISLNLESLKNNYNLKIFSYLTICYFLLRAWFSPVAYLAMQDMFLLISSALLYLLITVYSPTKMLRRGILGVFFLLVAFNLLMFVPSLNEIRDDFFDYANGEYNTGLYNHRNFFSNILSLFACFSLSFILFSNAKKSIRFFWLVVFVSCSLGVSFSLARGGYLSLSSGVLIIITAKLCFKSKSRNQLGGKVVLLLLSGIGLLLGAGTLLEKRFTDSRPTTSKITDGTGRGEYFAITLDQVPDAPILGSGSRSVEYLCYQNWSDKLYGYKFDFKFTHNEYLQLLADYGMVGLSLILILLFWLVYTAITSFTLHSSEGKSWNLAYCVAALSSLLAMGVNMFVSFPTRSLPNLLLLTFTVSLIMTSSRNKIELTFFKQYFIKALVLITTSILILYAGCYGIKEFRSGMAFWKQGIIGDDMNWSVDKQKSKDWESALLESIEYSPNFDRLNKLGLIYRNKSSDRKANLALAEECFKASKKRHSMHPTSRFNLASIYREQGRYQLSESEYNSLEDMAKKREEILSFYTEKSKLYFLMAREKSGLEADLLYLKALQSLDESVRRTRGNRNRVKTKILEKILLARYLNLVQMKSIDEALKVFDRYALIGHSKPYKDLADSIDIIMYNKELIRHSNFCKSRGKLLRSAETLVTAKRFCLKAKLNADPVLFKTINTVIEYIDEQLSEYERAGIL